MEKRKNPEKDLRKKSGLFFQIGLLIAMGLAVSAFEFRVAEIVNPIDPDFTSQYEDILVPITDIPEPKPPKPVIAKPIAVPDTEVEVDKTEFVIDPVDIPTEIPDPEPIEEPEEEIKDFWDYVEEAPTPKGGYAAFYKFVSKNIKYPRRERKMGIEGKVFVQFIIDEEGNLTQVKAIKGVSQGLDQEAERVLRKAPQWKAGRQGGRRVKVRMVIPIKFSLD